MDVRLRVCQTQRLGLSGVAFKRQGATYNYLGLSTISIFVSTLVGASVLLIALLVVRWYLRVIQVTVPYILFACQAIDVYIK